QPTVVMPRAPPEVRSYGALAVFQSWYADSVVVAIDLEAIDHRSGKYARGLENWEKVSELGVSYLDLRGVRLGPNPTSTNSTEKLSTVSKSIVSQHKIINRWRNFTEETCDASHHKSHGIPHTAMPYHCKVAESQFRTYDQALSDLDHLLRDLSIKDLTAEEREACMLRTVIVLYWDARMEANWFHDMEFNVGYYGAMEWDFQKFKPFRSRFEKAKTGAEKAFDSLGALGAGVGGMAVLHNAANDTFTQVVAFLRFMVMTEAEWKNWRGRSDFYPGDLDPVDLSWISDETWKANQELRPLLQPGERPDEVEEPEDPEPEPVIVHHSAMTEIKAGVIFTTVDSAIESK
ncbi:hypothetical protein B0T13DRAFT_528075, partial [Neurospora crassa]